jgi:hypothetical protein
VAKGLCYKPEGLGLDSRWGEIIFYPIHQIIPAALGPGVHSVSKKNEYQKQKKIIVLGSGAQPVRRAKNLTAICESRLSRQRGIFNISRPYRPPRPVTGIALRRIKNSDFVLLAADCALCLLSRKAALYIRAFVRLRHLGVTVKYNWKAWNATNTYTHTCRGIGMVLISSCTPFN